MTSTTVAIISGAAALGGSAITGVVAVTGVKRTATANSEDLAKRLEHDRRLAREARDQERRERAYVSILQYVNWLTHYLKFLVKDTTSRMLTGDAPSESDVHHPTVTGPTTQENEATLALVTAVASPHVLAAFEQLLAHKQSVESQLATAAVHSARPASETGQVDLTIPDALDKVNTAFKEANSSSEAIRGLIRAELNPAD